MFRRNFLSMVLLVGMLVTQSVPQASAATNCNQVQFVSDLTVPDGTSFAPGATFTKTWRLMNVGTCTWTMDYSLVWDGGEVMGAPMAQKLPVSVPPGQMIDLSVNLKAPAFPANYKAFFKLSDASGAEFGMGDSANLAFYVDINVVQVSAVIYDFVANAPYAQWKSGAGLLPFPGTSGDNRGYALPVGQPHLEDDSLDTSPGLLTVPQNKFNGYIQATYPEFEVQTGDRLQTLVNCEFGATACYTTFRIDYLLPNGAQKTLWTWKEAYDKRFYRADIDLSALAGQRVRFVFMLLSSGFANGDRALWGSPRIVRFSASQPPAPPATLTPLPPLPSTPTPIGQPPPTIQPTGCNKAAFVTDATVPDGTVFSPSAAFTKTWRLKNIGSCSWSTAYKLIYYSGDRMGASTAVNLPWNAAPSQTVDISVDMVAPGAPGKYRGYWILSNASGQFFGIGPDASRPIWVEINVAGDSPIGAGYDFTSNVCSAEWRSGAGVLPCPGADGSSSGFIIKQEAPTLEDGSTGTTGLLAAPQNRYNGYLQGFYPTFTVQPGDKFQATVGCAHGSACYLTYRLDYMTSTGYIGTFWQWREQNDQKVHNATVDLTPLAGRSVRFILTVLATGSAANDRALWGAPRIVRVASAPPTVTPLPPTDNWPTYTNTTYAFQFKYPPQSERFFETASSILIKMPIAPGTNLREKYLQLTVRENINPCQSPLGESGTPRTPENVVINGISFLKQTAGDAGVGHLHEWVGYSTLKNNACISMEFVLHSLNADNFATPIPEFDKAAESAVFTQVMSTFGWMAAPITPIPSGVPPVVVPSPAITKLFMMDASSGWALGNSSVLRTTDGGVTWYNMMPGLASVRNGFFQNASKGWVLSTDAIYRTTDGGNTWTRYSVPFNGGYIQFLDDANGFVLTGQGIGMQKHPVSLYQTSDGGATWTLKFAHDPNLPTNGLPVSGHKNGMAFRDTSAGWIGGDVPSSGVYIYNTGNSGMAWAQQPLTLPAGYENAITSTTAPIFFGANDAILPVWMSNGASTRGLFLYITHNGGATWSLSPASAPSSGKSFDFVSINDGFVWDGDSAFQVTNNAGASWRQVTPNVNFGETIAALDFVSTTTGWVYDTDPNGNPAFYRTTDGGSTWTVLFGTPSLPPTSTPAPDPVAFVGSVVDALNARNFDAAKALMDQSFAFAYWESQGISNTPDQAIDALRNTHLGATPLTPDPAKDLATLLGGLNPYSIMGLDPAKSQALYVSGWGVDGKQEAILYATRRADGKLYWYGVLVAPYKFIHDTPTPTLTPNSVLPDLTIAQMKLELENATSCLGPNDGLGVRLWIRNNGQGSAGSFVVRANGIDRTVNALNAGETVEVFFANGGNPVTVTVDPLNAVAESDENNNSRSEMVPVPTPPAECTFSGPYAVTRVAPGDVLNVRSWYGISYPIIGSFPPNAVDIMRTGPSADVGGALWVEVQMGDGRRGWVNSYYLKEYFSHEAFCADARIPALLAQLKGSVNQSNGDLLASIVSPEHGLDVRLWAYGPAVNYTPAQARNVFTSADVHAWGSGPAGGTEYGTGTFSQIIQPKLQEVFNHPNMETYCDNLTKVFPLSQPWPYPNVRYYNLYKPGSEQFFDWRTWLIGFEYVDGQPYLHSLVSIVWEP